MNKLIIMQSIPVITHTNNGDLQLITLAERERQRSEKDRIHPEPCRLTFIRMNDACQFCQNPKGDVYTHSICIADLFGFFSCTECKDVASKAVDDWMATNAYGRAKKFLGKNITIVRSSGDEEDDWFLDEMNPIVRIIDNVEYVACISRNRNCKRLCMIDMIIEKNQHIE